MYKKTILIIEDEHDIADLLAMFFDTLGYSSVVCHDYKTAQDVLQVNMPWAIFCDFLLPDSRGDHIYNELKTRYDFSTEKFVLMTGTLIDEEELDFTKTYNIKVLQKPFSLDALRQLITKLEDI